MVQCNSIDLFENCLPLGSRMRQDELETEWLRREAIADERDEESDPAHKVIEQRFALGMNLVHKGVE